MNSSEVKFETKIPLFGFWVFVFAATLGLTFIWITWLEPSWGRIPGSKGDAVFDDSVAYNLANDVGFNLNFSDLDWLEVYSQPDANGANDWIFAVEAEGPTTIRAPGFPYAVSVIYRIFGRDFDAVRIFNMFVLAFGLSCLICCVRHYYGYVAAWVAIATLAFDFGVFSSAGELVADSLGTGLMSITFSLVVWAWNSPGERSHPSWRWAIAGLFFGMTMLVQLTLVAWVMQLLVLIVLAAISMLVRRKNPARLVQGAFVFLTVAVLLGLPWWLRNCRVTEEFSPIGNAASIGLVGGFSDETIDNWGNWYAPNVVRRRAQTARERDLSELTLAQQEYKMGQDSQDEAMNWLSKNWQQMPKLMAMKALSHLALVQQVHPAIPIANSLILFGACVGILVTWPRLGAWIALVTFLSLATTMLTWSDHGRFAIPIRPLWHVACALGIVYFWSPKFRHRARISANR